MTIAYLKDNMSVVTALLEEEHHIDDIKKWVGKLHVVEGYQTNKVHLKSISTYFSKDDVVMEAFSTPSQIVKQEDIENLQNCLSTLKTVFKYLQKYVEDTDMNLVDLEGEIDDLERRFR
tara:strand:- start:4691 stop:5047 length:357 start_codon:yes stop_codon:yes gene_type:complete